MSKGRDKKGRSKGKEPVLSLIEKRKVKQQKRQERSQTSSEQFQEQMDK
ncbi:MAG: hypothetical protein WCT49_04310 [Candidatus Paceibacterota bacterium]|jgi:hypothetical protein|nr:hypothetical protein [Candidatus Paceibacterota bacterium]